MEIIEDKIKQYKTIKKQIDTLDKEFNELKKDIIEQMKEEGVSSIGTTSGTASVSYPHSFDQHECILQNERECSEFLSIKTVTETIEEFDQKGFKKKHPDLFAKYQIPLTPRLTIK